MTLNFDKPKTIDEWDDLTEIEFSDDVLVTPLCEDDPVLWTGKDDIKYTPVMTDKGWRKVKV